MEFFTSLTPAATALFALLVTYVLAGLYTAYRTQGWIGKAIVAISTATVGFLGYLTIAVTQYYNKVLTLVFSALQDQQTAIQMLHQMIELLRLTQ